jgi:ribosome-binding factor A
MTSRKISRKNLLSGCSEPGERDGKDPRYDDRESPPKVKNRKALQLCAQVAETLTQVLGGECDDDLLRDLLVESVVPAPSSARLLVTVSLADPRVSREEVLGRLEAVRSRLRAEVVSAIHRRKAPDLDFLVVARPTPQ